MHTPWLLVPASSPRRPSATGSAGDASTSSAWGSSPLASAACALAPSAEVLIACRAIQGLGAAIVMPLGLTLLTSAFPPEKRGAVVGIWGGIAGLAVASGPLIGGALTQGLNWHWIFWVNVPIGALALIGARRASAGELGAEEPVRHPRPRSGHRGTGVLIWGLVQGGQKGWGSTENVVGLTVGILLIAAFVLQEARSSEPMIPLRLFRTTAFSSAVGTQFLMAAAIFSAAFLTSQFFQFGLGDSPFGTGLRFLPWTATPLLIAPLAGALSDKVGSRALVVPGLVMQGIGFAWIVWLAASSSGYASYVLPFVIAGVGISMALPCVTAGGLNAVPPELLGKAAGTLNTMQQFGAVFGVAVVTAVFNSKGSLTDAASVTSGYRPALAVSAGISILGAVVAIGMRRTPRAQVAEPSVPLRGASQHPRSELVRASSSD